MLDPLQADKACLIKLVKYNMPFGKYQGRCIADLPSAYLGWFMKQPLPRGELGQLLVTMYEIDLNGLRYLLEPFKQPMK